MPTNNNRNLTNDQRTRLEQIAKDEFAIKKSELQEKKNKIFQEWKDKEIKKMETSDLAKKYAKLRKELDAVTDKINAAGFTITIDDGKARCKIKEVDGFRVGGSRSKKHPKVEQMREKTKLDYNAFTRAQNEVLSVIWSMEQSFSDCINLIKTKVSSIK